MRLSPNNLVDLSWFNNSVFLANSNEEHIQSLERRVSDTRHVLLQLLRDLNAAKQQPGVTILSEKGVQNFLRRIRQ